MKYTNINHNIRVKLGISFSEYCVLDLIYRLSNTKKDGFCFASKSTLSEMIGIPLRTIKRNINDMEMRGFLTKENSGKILKTTTLWSAEFPCKNGASLALNNGANVALEETETVPKVYSNGASLALENGASLARPSYNKTLLDLNDKKGGSIPPIEKNKKDLKKTEKIPPQIEDVINYFFKQKKYSQGAAEYEAKKYMASYKSKGWMIGKSKMKCWRSAIDTWVLNSEKWGTKPKEAIEVDPYAHLRKK